MKINEVAAAIQKKIENVMSNGVAFATKDIAEILPDAIIKDSILKGKSPVQGKRFDGYSESYKEAIKDKRYVMFDKKQRPVNLKLSGEMLESIKVTANQKSGKIKIEFTDQKAKWHNNGSGNLPERRIFPKPGEDWSRLIKNKIRDALKKVGLKISKIK